MKIIFVPLLSSDMHFTVAYFPNQLPWNKEKAEVYFQNKQRHTVGSGVCTQALYGFSSRNVYKQGVFAVTMQDSSHSRHED